MNERAAPPAAAAASRRAPQPRPTVSGRDREFLPAALEILEIAAAAAPLALIATICALRPRRARLVVLRPPRRARGRAGQDRDGRPFQGDRAARSRQGGGDPRRGGPVGQGGRSAASSSTRPRRTRMRRAAEDALNASLAEIARRRYAIRGRRGAQRTQDAARRAPGRRGPEKRGPDGRRRTRRDRRLSPVEELAGRPELDDRLGRRLRPSRSACARRRCCAPISTQLSDALKALDKQMAQKLATRKRLDMSIAFQHTLMDTLNQRVATRQEAIDKKVGTKINLYDAKEELEKSQSQLASDEGQLIETDAALRELQSEKAKTVSQFIADNENKLAEASRKADEARQALAKAAARLGAHQALRADRRRRAADGGDHGRPGRHDRPAARRHHAERRQASGRGARRQSRHRLRQARPAGRRSRSTPSPSPASACCTARWSRSPRARSRKKKPSARWPTPPPRPTPAQTPATAPGQAGELRLPGHGRARRNRHDDRQRHHPPHPRHDRHRRNQDRLPARHRLSPLAARQDRVRGGKREVARGRSEPLPSCVTCSSRPSGFHTLLETWLGC